MYPRLSVNIVTWNSMRYLPDLLESLENQTMQDFSILVIDNGSTDGIEPFLREAYPNVTLVRNVRNLGFAAAHNQGIRYAIEHWKDQSLEDCFVLVANPDAILKETYIEELMRAAESEPEVGSFGGKLLRVFHDGQEDEVLTEKIYSDVIDTTGLRGYKSRSFFERGAGEIDEGQYDQEQEVFGVSGAMALYRASALEMVASDGMYFDAQFFLYKEDIDLAWRLRQIGWEARYVPKAVGYHYRGMFGKERAGIWERMKNRWNKPRKLRYLSTRNQCWMMMKNMRIGNLLLAFPWVFLVELRRFIYVCLFEPRNFPAFFEAWISLPTQWNKRQQWSKHPRCVTASQMRKWF